MDGTFYIMYLVYGFELCLRKVIWRRFECEGDQNDPLCLKKNA